MSQTSFLDDYSEGAHPKILEKLFETNLSQQTAYGDVTQCSALSLIIEYSDRRKV